MGGVHIHPARLDISCNDFKFLRVSAANISQAFPLIGPKHETQFTLLFNKNININRVEKKSRAP